MPRAVGVHRSEHRRALVVDAAFGAPDRYAMYAMYAHLQTGSARVHTGDQVKEGDVLGLLGSSGYASAPHLHFSIQNGPDALTSDSLPFVTDGYQLTGTAVIDPVSLTVNPVTSPQTPTASSTSARDRRSAPDALTSRCRREIGRVGP